VTGFVKIKFTTSVKPLDPQKLDKEDNHTAMTVCTVIQASTI